MVTNRDKMAYEALLKEIRVVDNLLETHANIMIVLISGMLFFIFQVEPRIAKYVLSMLGIAVSLEFFCHTYRLKHIAKSATERLIEIEKRIGIDTRRKPAMLWKIKMPTGSTLLLCISIVFMALWLLLIVLLNTGLI